MADDSRHDSLTDADASVRRVDKNIRKVGERGAIRITLAKATVASILIAPKQSEPCRARSNTVRGIRPAQ
jgi:hypothetical protein